MVKRCPKCSIIFSSSIHKLDICPYCGETLTGASLEKDGRWLDSEITNTKKTFVDMTKHTDDRPIGAEQKHLDELIETTEKEIKEIQDNEKTE